MTKRSQQQHSKQAKRRSGESAQAEKAEKRRSTQAEAAAPDHVTRPTLFADATFPRSTLAALAPEHVTSLLYSLVLATTQSILAALAQCKFTSGTSGGGAQAERMLLSGESCSATVKY